LSSDKNVQFYLKFVSEKQKQLKKSLEQLVLILVGENPEKKKDAANSTMTIVKDLKSILPESEVPAWLNSIFQGLDQYQKGTFQPFHLMQKIMFIKSDMDEHEWIHDGSEISVFDFDSIFQHYKSESRLGELFDEIIKLLEDIHGSGDVDSVSMMAALGKVIATLKQNIDGSYFSLNSAWSFLMSFLKNYMWEELVKIPVLGTSMKALKKTINETNEEMYKVHNSVEKKMKSVVEEEVKGLANKSNFAFLGYDKKGSQLPETNSSHILDAKF
jgi:hypothetical protein